MEPDGYWSVGIAASTLALGTWLAALLKALLDLTGGKVRKLDQTTNRRLIARAEVWLEQRDSYRSILRFLELLNFAVLASVVHFFAASMLGGEQGLFSAVLYTVAVVVAMLLLTESVATLLVKQDPWLVLRASGPLVDPLYAILSPIVLAPILMLHRGNGEAEDDDEDERATAEDEIMSLVEKSGHEDGENGGLQDSERRMIRGIFDLDETLVKEIMTPRVDVNAVPCGSSVSLVRTNIAQQGHSRIPVCRGSIDEIIGVVYAKDLLDETLDPAASIDPIMHKAMFVPETKNVRDLFEEFRQHQTQIAIVIDEYGGTAGLVTIEDILEEIVGEIRDEYDHHEEDISLQLEPDGSLEVDARSPIDDINETLDLDISEEEEYDTIGGFVSSELGRIPETGEQLTIGELEVTILEADERRIMRLRLRKFDPATKTSLGIVG